MFNSVVYKEKTKPKPIKKPTQNRGASQNKNCHEQEQNLQCPLQIEGLWRIHEMFPEPLPVPDVPVAADRCLSDVLQSLLQVWVPQHLVCILCWLRKWLEIPRFPSSFQNFSWIGVELRSIFSHKSKYNPPLQPPSQQKHQTSSCCNKLETSCRLVKYFELQNTFVWDKRLCWNLSFWVNTERSCVKIKEMAVFKVFCRWFCVSLVSQLCGFAVRLVGDFVLCFPL